MTETAGRRILGAKRWPDEQDVDDIGALLQVFECESIEDLEDYLWALLPEDPGDVRIDEGGRSMMIDTYLVTMWGLDYPFSGAEFDAYLFELDERTTLESKLLEIPEPEDDSGEADPRIVPYLAELFRTTPAEFSAALGSGWRRLDLHWVGSSSDPSVYLWTGSAVLALNSDVAYLYRRTAHFDPWGLLLFGGSFEEVSSTDELWSDGGPSLDWLTSFVVDLDEAEKRGTCPSCGSGDVTHILYGLRATLEPLPYWVRLGGCSITEQNTDRYCNACGHRWEAEWDPESPNE